MLQLLEEPFLLLTSERQNNVIIEYNVIQNNNASSRS
jgi:hypothetical protein